MSNVESAGLRRLDIDDPEPVILAYSVEGKVTGEQGQEVFERIEKAAKRAEGLELVEVHARLSRRKETIERVAVMGDQRWLAAYTAIFDPITKADLRHFTTEEKETAAAWVPE